MKTKYFFIYMMVNRFNPGGMGTQYFVNLSVYAEAVAGAG